MNKLVALLSLFALVATAANAASVADFTDIVPKVDENPVPVKTPPPAYPKDLMDQGVSGTAVVTIVIDENGDVLAAEGRKASHEAFMAPAVDAVKTWKFNPAKVAGKAVKVKVAVPIKFNHNVTASAQ